MTVRDLIEKLQQADPNIEVKVECTKPFAPTMDVLHAETVNYVKRKFVITIHPFTWSK